MKTVVLALAIAVLGFISGLLNVLKSYFEYKNARA